MAARGQKPTFRLVDRMSAMGPKFGSRTSCRIIVEKRARRATSIEQCQKSLAETLRLRLGLGTGVVAANQPASVVRTVPTPIPAVVHPTPIRPDVTHANRAVVGSVA